MPLTCSDFCLIAAEYGCDRWYSTATAKSLYEGKCFVRMRSTRGTKLALTLSWTSGLGRISDISKEVLSLGTHLLQLCLLQQRYESNVKTCFDGKLSGVWPGQQDQCYQSQAYL